MRPVPLFLQIVEHQFASGILARAVARVFSPEIGDALAVEAPAGLAGMLGDVDAVGAVDVHIIDVADALPSFALVDDERDLGAVGRDMRIHLVDRRRVGQIHRLGAVGVDHEQFPVVPSVRWPVGFVDQLEGNRRQVQRLFGLGSSFRRGTCRSRFRRGTSLKARHQSQYDHDGYRCNAHSGTSLETRQCSCHCHFLL